MKQIKFLALILASLTLLFSSCKDLGSTVDELKVDIDGVGWSYHNYSRLYQDLIWDGNHSSDPFLRFKFSLWYEGEEIQPGELTSFTAVVGSNTLTIPVENDIYLDSNSDPNVHGFDSYYIWETDGDQIPLGPWNFTMKFIDDSETLYSRTFSKPGFKIDDTVILPNSFIVNDIAVIDNITTFNMVKIGTITSATYATGDLTVVFKTNGADTLVRSGSIYIYKLDGTRLGTSKKRFIDENNIVHSKLNVGNGSNFKKDGTPNTIVLDLSTDFSSDASASGTYKAVLVLFDGDHYNGDPDFQGAFDGMSVSDPFGFTF